MSNEPKNDELETEENDEILSELDSDETLDDLKKQLSDAQAKVSDYWDQLVRAKAEVENIKRRATRDVENARKFSVEKFANDLIPVMDSLEQGMDSINDDTDISVVKEGMALTIDLLIKTLDKQGMSQVNPKGERFNPEYHEAMTMVPSEEIPADHVMDVFQKGYQLNGRLIRPARVVVSQGNGETPSIDTKA
jgi:molecular chaperone GrpE